MFATSSYDSHPSCTISSIRELNSTSPHFRIHARLRGRNHSITTAAMVDCGATALFLNQDFVTRNHVRCAPLHKPIDVFNIDGTPNRAGRITHFARLALTVDNQERWMDFLITNLGGEDIILGLPWLRKVNPEIDWEKGRLSVKPPRVTIEEVPDEEILYSHLAATHTETPILELPELEPPAENPHIEVPLEATLEPSESAAVEEPPIHRIRANHKTRRAWVKAGILEEQTEEVWCAAGFTYSQQLAEEANRDKPVKTFEEMVPEQYRDFKKVFSESASERLPAHQPWDHAIDLVPGAPATMRTKIYPMSLNEQEELDRFLEENLRKGYIVPSKSPISSLVFFIKKKDGKLRFVQDYRKLNEYTVKNRYPLPLVADIISRLQGARYFTKFDVRWGYNNIRIKKGHEWKGAFATTRGLFEPKVMFFGLTNSPATFQALMNAIFADLIAAGKVAVYLDDILIFSNDLEEHRRMVREVLTRLEKHDLYLRPEKCEFEQQQIEYLGLIISEGEVRMDPVKVAAVRDWPVPTNLRELRGFLGFANFYRRFIRNFAKIARPLNDLTKKDTSLTWTDTRQKAFDTLREAFISAPILALWTPDRPTRIEVDASGFATGGALMQKQDDGQWHPVAFRSASMQPAERNYEIYDREMLAIIEALKDWRNFLEGLPQPFDIITDHSNLEFWRTAQDLTRRQARWALYLSRFDFHMIHRPGRVNTQADALSRMAVHHVSDSDDNRQQTVLKPGHFVKIAASILQNPLEDRIRKASEREAQVLEGLKTVKEHGLQRLANGIAEWEEDNGLVYYRGRVYVPANDDLRTEVLRQCHDHPTAGHPGLHGTLDLVSTHFWWPTLHSFVEKYVEGCEVCARKKIQRHPRAVTQPLDVPSGLWEEVGVDLITQLPNSQGYDAVLVCTDLYGKQIHAIPCTSSITAEGVADIYYREIFRLHGLPLHFKSDRGPQFAAKLMRSLLARLGIKSDLTSGYRPQSNGQTERANQEVEKYIRLYVGRQQDDWAEHLPMAEFVINSRTHSALGMSPFELTYGYLPLFNIPVGQRSGIPAVDDHIRILREARQDAGAALHLGKKQQKEGYERGKQKAHQFKVGDLVWLSAEDINLQLSSEKLGDRQLGPYRILEKIGPLDYRLDLPLSLDRLHPVFHVDKLYPWKGNSINGEIPTPPEPVYLEDEDEPEYEVEEILDSRVRWKKLEYLVKWKGYDAGHNSWEPAANLSRAPKIVRAFHKKHPTAAKP
ncbi:hypothetical protein HHX47_DHR12000006 [Lentinula edodes]|nr:hypothetical protein HHX47_DHR12000006 [Lentinula edodes]